jgi:hypothetical protein
MKGAEHNHLYGGFINILIIFSIIKYLIVLSIGYT